MANEVALVLPLTLDPSTGSLVSTADQATIWANRVRMVIETILGERVMRPDFGTKIPSDLFNTVSSMEEAIQLEVSRAFVEHLPLLELGVITLTHDEKANRMNAEITYKLPNKLESTIKAGVMTVSATNPPYEELA